MTTAAASKLEEKPIKKQNKKKKKLSFADDHGQPLFTGELYSHAACVMHHIKALDQSLGFDKSFVDSIEMM